jgi:hypothetical protein
MRKLLLILLFAVASCTEPLVPTNTLCVQYSIGSASTTSTVEIVDGYVVCDKWRLRAMSTPDNKTVLTRDTAITTELGTVTTETAFVFNNNQSGDTVRGIYVNHTAGSVCNTYDTLPVVVIKVPCKPRNTNGDF